MNFLLRLAGSYVDAVLNTFYPPPHEPSLADLHAQQLADREAEEEVGTGGHVCRDDVWPEDPDPMDHLIVLLEDVRNLLASAVSPEAAAESPGSVVPPTDPGHPNLTPGVAQTAAFAIQEWMDGVPCANPPVWQKFADELYAYDAARKQTK